MKTMYKRASIQFLATALGILTAIWLSSRIESPMAWFLGGLLWGLLSIPVIHPPTFRLRAASVIGISCAAGFSNWALTHYFPGL